jgi:hypothetical protein
LHFLYLRLQIRYRLCLPRKRLILFVRRGLIRLNLLACECQLVAKYGLDWRLRVLEDQVLEFLVLVEYAHSVTMPNYCSLGTLCNTFILTAKLGINSWFEIGHHEGVMTAAEGGVKGRFFGEVGWDGHQWGRFGRGFWRQTGGGGGKKGRKWPKSRVLVEIGRFWAKKAVWRWRQEGSWRRE